MAAAVKQIIILWFALAGFFANAESLCRLDFVADCEPAGAVSGLSQTQMAHFQNWLARYSRLDGQGENAVLALSDLPHAIRYVIFVDEGRVISREQVRIRLRSLGANPDTHPVWRALLPAMPRAFGGERRFYAGLELALHWLVSSDPGRLANLTRETAAPKMPLAPPMSVPGLRETARAD